MKKILTLSALLLLGLNATANDWTLPEYTGSYQPLTPGDTIYIYNTEAKGFLTEGNDWGTHASVGPEGLLYTVAAVEGMDNTYTLRNYSQKKSWWYNLFITDGGHMYVDYNQSGDIYFSFKDLGNNTYYIYGAASNDYWKNASEGMEEYYVGRYTTYTNTQTEQATGTGVIYAPQSTEGEMQFTWAFVSQADYAEYYKGVATYNRAADLADLIYLGDSLGINVTAAEDVYGNTSSTLDELNAAIDELNAAIDRDAVAKKLEALISEANTYGVNTDEAQAVLDNEASTKEELQAAYDTLDKTLLAYYKEVITPDNPLDLSKLITNSTFDSADSWTNNINATTFNTGTWTDTTWETEAWTGTYLNVWGASMQGTVEQTITGLPEGIYNIQMSIYHDAGTITLFANDNEKNVPALQTATQHYNVTTKVGEDGILTLGVRQAEDPTTIWLTLDNAKLTYYGAGIEAYRSWINSLLESAPSFEDAVVQDSLVTEYNKVLGSVNEAEDEEAIMAVIPAYQDILDKIEANMLAYTNLSEAINTTRDASDASTTYYKTAVSNYITETAQPTYDSHKLGTEAVNAVTTQLTTYQSEMSSLESYYTQLMNYKTKLEEAYNTSTSIASTKTAAEDLIDELNAFDEDNTSVADYKSMITRVNDMILLLSIPAEEITDDNPVDYTAKIADPSFDNGATEWINDGWATCGYNSWETPADGERFDTNYLNLWNATGGCRVYQQFNDLPNGTYTFAIYAFADAAGLEVYAGSNDAISVTAASGAGDDGYYGHLYEVTTLVSDGTLEIGVRSMASGAVWAMIDNATLTYYGTNSQRTPTAISDITTSNSNKVYTITGQHVSHPIHHGIYIIDGRKVVIK